MRGPVIWSTHIPRFIPGTDDRGAKSRGWQSHSGGLCLWGDTAGGCCKFGPRWVLPPHCSQPRESQVVSSCPLFSLQPGLVAMLSPEGGRPRWHISLHCGLSIVRDPWVFKDFLFSFMNVCLHRCLCTTQFLVRSEGRGGC